jgi:NTE family protein
VVASNLSRQRPQVFNAHCTPDLAIWRAVRASISIPLIFEPVRINDEYFVDGGLALNFPIDLYDRWHCDPDTGVRTEIRNPSTLGFYLEPRELADDGDHYHAPCVAIDSLKSYALALGSYLTQNANARYIHPDDRRRTVFVDDLGVSATDFAISEVMIQALVDSGRRATRAWFAASSTAIAPSPLRKAG